MKKFIFAALLMVSSPAFAEMVVNRTPVEKTWIHSGDDEESAITVKPGGYAFLETSSGMCAGSIKGGLMDLGGYQVFVSSPDKTDDVCIVAFTVGKDGNLYNADESESCMHYHGISCDFSAKGRWGLKGK